MKTVDAVSFFALLAVGLGAMALGARIASVPDLFAWQLGLDLRAGDALALARQFGGTFAVLGLAALGSAFLSPAGRVAALALMPFALAAVTTVADADAVRHLIASAYGLGIAALGAIDLLAFGAVLATHDADRPVLGPDSAIGSRQSCAAGRDA